MKDIIINKMNRIVLDAILNFIKKEIVLTIVVLLAILSCFVNTPKISYIDFRVLGLLFTLMLVIGALKNLKVFDVIATFMLRRCNTYITISSVLVFTTFISSMFITNDVALLTFVPLSIIVSKKANIDILNIVILQTLAANLGSSFTPMGNPQNLYLYTFYNISVFNFLKITLPIVLFSLIFLAILLLKNKKIKLNLDIHSVKIRNKYQSFIYFVLFTMVLISIFHVIDYKVSFLIICVVSFLLNKKLFIQIDYSILITFIGFFIFTGNVSTIDGLNIFMQKILIHSKATFLYSILSSQIISNAPAAMLLSKFSRNYRELILGVNIGGMGTLTASLASVISYKLYTIEFKNSNKQYIKIFSLYNCIGLIVFVIVSILFL